MKLTKVFSTESRKLTLANRDKLSSLKDRLKDILPNFGERLSLLCTPVTGISAVAASCCGIISFAEPFLVNSPDKILLTVAVHECMHLRVGGELRRSLIQRHPDIDAIFHDKVINDWLQEMIEIRIDEEFIDYKNWRPIYDGWLGPLQIELEKAIKAINNYFDYVKNDKIVIMKGHLYCIMSKESFQSSSIDKLYEYNKDETTYKIMAGYGLINYLNECYRSKLRHDIYGDLWVLEEGFANYISSTLVGTTLEDMQKWARQDEYKIDLAKKISKQSPSINEAMNAVKSYHELFEFCHRIKIV